MARSLPAHRAHPAPGRGVLALGLAAGLAGLLIAACAPGSLAGAGGGRVYVLGADGAVTALGPGRVGGALPGVPGVPGALAMAAGPGRTLVFLVHEEGGKAALVLREAAVSGTAKRIALPAMGKGALLAAGAGHAAVLYQPAGVAAGAGDGRACRLAVVALGRLEADRGDAQPARVIDGPLCEGGEVAGRIDVAAIDGRALVYASTVRYRPAEGEEAAGAGGGRVVALDAASGAPVARRSLAVAPGPLALAGAAPDAGQGGQRAALWVVESGAGEGQEGRPDRLLGLDPLTLEPGMVQSLHTSVGRIAGADGVDRLVALRADGREVRAIDVRTGGERPLARLPGEALALVVADGRIFAAGAAEGSGGGRVWEVDPRTGRVTEVLTGVMPIALAASSSSFWVECGHVRKYPAKVCAPSHGGGVI